MVCSHLAEFDRGCAVENPRLFGDFPQILHFAFLVPANSLAILRAVSEA